MTLSLRVRVLMFVVAAAIIFPETQVQAQYAEQIISDGAIHYWRFEETDTSQPAKDEIPDQAANGDIPAQSNNPGTYEGGVTLGHASAFPALGKAAHFDEQNGTHVLLDDPQHPGNSISIEAWVLLEGDHTVGFSPIVARWDGSYELDVNHTGQGGELDFVIRNDFNEFFDPHSDGPMEVDEWHHVVGIFAGESDGGDGTGIVYLDGERQIDFEGSGDLQDAGGDDGSWYIGRTRKSDSNFAWLGLIDEVAIYPFELTEEQIANHIALAMGPVRTSGDFNGNGELDASDIDSLSAEVRAGTNNLEFDVNSDGSVNSADRSFWVADLKVSWFGDANLDGLFNSSDLVTVFSVGKFETGETAGWAEGDWDGDAVFGTGDLVAAFSDAGFEVGKRPSAAVVPEPTLAFTTWLTICLVVAGFRKRAATK
ncbi:MAG: hypothetical protein P8N76_26470 [Pirellulaceae bacterium]|nr:hypothetical protein [Pirellulaceae bacterium]